jgi:hypothetical protein
MNIWKILEMDERGAGIDKGPVPPLDHFIYSLYKMKV